MSFTWLFVLWVVGGFANWDGCTRSRPWTRSKQASREVGWMSMAGINIDLECDYCHRLIARRDGGPYLVLY
jgi:hypothetical protein